MVEGLWIFGNGNRDDSFGVSFRYVLSRFGLGASQALVDGLSGMAFTLPLLTEEDCTAWWMEGGNDIRAEFVSGAFGLSHEVINVKSERSDNVILCRERDFWKSIKEKLDRNFIVLENTWPLWSVIDGWNDEESRVERVSFEGFPMFPNPNGVFHVFGKGGEAIPKKDVLAQAFEFGEKLTGTQFDTKGILFGIAIEEATKNRLSNEHFCVPCGNDDMGCFTRTLSRIRGRHLSLAGFIDEAGEYMKLPEKYLDQKSKSLGIAEKLLGILKNPELSNLWHDKKQIIPLLPF